MSMGNRKSRCAMSSGFPRSAATPAADPDKSILARELCEIAVKRFCEPRPRRPTYYSPHYRREASVAEKSLPLLLQALAASGRDEDLSRVIRFVRGIAGRIQPGRLPGSLP